MNIYQSAEDYLEMILMLQEEKGFVRSKDIADNLGVSKPSVSVAMKKLRENGYITMDKENMISLTESGRDIAERMYHRHKVLSELFIRLGVSQDAALEDACKIEHVLSEETFAAIEKHIHHYGG